MKNRKDGSREERRVQKEWNKAAKRKKSTDGVRMEGIKGRMDIGRNKRRRKLCTEAGRK